MSTEDSLKIDSQPISGSIDSIEKCLDPTTWEALLSDILNLHFWLCRWRGIQWFLCLICALVSPKEDGSWSKKEMQAHPNTSKLKITVEFATLQLVPDLRKENLNLLRPPWLWIAEFGE